MSPRPDTVTDLHAEPALARTILSWEPQGFDPLIDHFRIYAVRGESAPEEPQESDLIAKTVYPNVAHTNLDPAGETWTYTVLAVSDAGRRGRPSAPVTASSQPSVTATGREIATIGAFDGRTLEHHLAPTSYSQIPEEFPDAVIEYEQGADEPGTAWPYLLPGPGDAWAGKTAYRARWTFTLEEAPRRSTTSPCGSWTPPAWAASCGSAPTTSTSPISSCPWAAPVAPARGMRPCRARRCGAPSTSRPCPPRCCRPG